MVREFKLSNEKGQEFSLMDIKNYCLLTEPNLGYSYQTEYEQIGNTFITNLRRIEQGQITGMVNFLNYDNYRNFIDYIENSETLHIIYKIPFKNGKKEYLKDIAIKNITKSEIQPNGVISESITFDCLSLWYEKTIAVYNMEASEHEIRWDFMWDSKFIEYTSRSLSYINKGHVEAPILVEIEGEVVNPIIELYVEGEFAQTIPLIVRAETGEKILYGSKENDFYIYLEDENGERTDLFDLDVIQFANDNVMRLPKNKSCEIRLSANDDIRKAKVTILTYYKMI